MCWPMAGGMYNHITINFMKKTFLLAIAIILSVIICKAQDTLQYKTYHYKDFNWTIKLPSNFEPVAEQIWQQKENSGTADLEKSNGTTFVNDSKFVFMFKEGAENNIIASYNIQDPKRHKSAEYVVQKSLYHEFETMSSKLKLDSSSTKMVINHLSFDVFVLKIDIPTKGFHDYDYRITRMFGDRNLSISIIFSDDKYGEAMLNAIKNSTFGNK